jgi:hypothetical protein
MVAGPEAAAGSGRNNTRLLATMTARAQSFAMVEIDDGDMASTSCLFYQLTVRE